jgi:urease accessory protein
MKTLFPATIHATVRAASRSSIPLLLIFLLPSIASAHIGVGSTDSLTAGLAHPWGGLDHLCAMIGVGLWAGQRGGRAVWLVPMAFLLVMAVGGLVGMAGVAVPMVETGIVGSVLIVGCLIAAAVRLPLVASAGLVALFALFHGHAHGIESTGASAGLLYGVGFLAATAVLLASGVGFGWLTCHWRQTAWVTRWAGAAIALCGVYLCGVYLCLPYLAH